jgi:hypothetical protein
MKRRFDPVHAAGGLATAGAIGATPARQWLALL